MGIIKAAFGSIGGTLADQWLESIEPAKMNNTILATYGVMVNRKSRRSSNTKRTEGIISNGSIIHVPENTYMILADGGKIIAATDEAGYYQVDNSRSPSIFFKSAEDKEIPGYNNTGVGAIKRPGGIKNTIKDSFERFKFGGTTPHQQRVYYINKMEIPDIRFGTKNPVPYTDRVLVPGRPVPCKITSFGSYSIKIVDPILFYSEVCSKTDKTNFQVDDMAEQYINEFLMAYTTALASLSQDNVLVSDIPIKTMELGQYMADVLDKEWLAKRGFLIHSVGIAGINYDEKTEELLNRYGQDSILLDPNARAARMAGSIASGIEAAGSNEGGAMLGFAGIGMGMNAANNLAGVMNPQGQQNLNAQTINQQNVSNQNANMQNNGWTCKCGHKNPENSAFCSQCGTKKTETNTLNANQWKCKCGSIETGQFCSNCGSGKPDNSTWDCSCGKTGNKGKFCPNCGNQKGAKATFKCDKCGWEPQDPTNPPKFCPNCGDQFNEQDKQ